MNSDTNNNDNNDNIECNKCDYFLQRALQSSRARPLVEALHRTGLVLKHVRSSSSSSSLPSEQREQQHEQWSTSSTCTNVGRISRNNIEAVAAASPLTTSTSIHVMQQQEFPVECRMCSTDPNLIESKCRAYVSSPVAKNSNDDGDDNSNSMELDGLVLCANRLPTSHEVEEALVHELVHVHDAVVTKLNLRDCHDLAYSEVRAAREAECHGLYKSFFKNSSKWCVRERAKTATESMFPNGQGSKCVDAVFQKAFVDEAPGNEGVRDRTSDR